MPRRPPVSGPPPPIVSLSSSARLAPSLGAAVRRRIWMRVAVPSRSRAERQRRSAYHVWVEGGGRWRQCSRSGGCRGGRDEREMTAARRSIPRWPNRCCLGARPQSRRCLCWWLVWGPHHRRAYGSHGQHAWQPPGHGVSLQRRRRQASCRLDASGGYADGFRSLWPCTHMGTALIRKEKRWTRSCMGVWGCELGGERVGGRRCVWEGNAGWSHGQLLDGASVDFFYFYFPFSFDDFFFCPCWRKAVSLVWSICVH